MWLLRPTCSIQATTSRVSSSHQPRTFYNYLSIAHSRAMKLILMCVSIIQMPTRRLPR